MEEIRLVLIGRTGAGKSSTGNNILDKRVFESSVCGLSVTRKSQRASGIRSGIRIEIVDTPGLFDTSLSQEDITREIVKCIAMTAPGPHAFLLVLRVDRFTQEEQNTVEHLKMVFGEGILDYLTVLFTRKDDLTNDCKTIDQYVQEAPRPLQDLLKSCNYRYVAFNNHGSEAERKEDVDNLIGRIKETVRLNGGGFYTNDMYEEAERAVQTREEQIRRMNEEKVERERREIEEECRQRMSLVDENERERTEPLKETLTRLKEQQTTGSDTELRNLQFEINELKNTIAEIKKEAAEAKAQAEKDAAQRSASCVVNVEEPRLQARQEINSGNDVIMGILKFLESDSVKLVVSAVMSAVATGLAGVVSEGFSKAKDKIKGLNLESDKGTTEGHTNATKAGQPSKDIAVD